MANLLLGLTVGLPWIGAICAWRIGDRRPRLLQILATSFVLLAGLAALGLLAFADERPEIRIPVGGVFGDFLLVADGLGAFIAAIATVIGSLTVLYSADYMNHEEQLGRYYALVLFFIGAMAGLGLAGSLLWMFFFWELTALSSYALISFHNDDPRAVAGGVKALLITSLGGIGLLAGALAAYAYLGSYEIDALLSGAQSLPPGVLSLVAFGFIAAAAAKSAQFPFQTWLPDAMEAPTPVSALIHAATMVNAGVYLLARVYPAFAGVPGWSTTVILIGLLSALFAGILAVTANDLKRVLAHSTVSQLGFMFYAVGTGGFFASQYHLLSHAIFKALLFLGAGAVITATGTRDLGLMGGLGRRMPFVRVTFIIGALALAGIPISNGFFSKELILENGLAHGPLWAYLLMLALTGLTALYTARSVCLVFYGRARGVTPVHDGLPTMRVVLGLLAFATLTSWVLAGPLGQLLADSLPFHTLSALPTSKIVAEILSAPATWITMVVVALGLLCWVLRARLSGVGTLLEPFNWLVETMFGLERLNQAVVSLTLKTAAALRRTQTGQLNWNIVGIFAGIAMILAILARGM
jgi:NADH-quinone oxidoreductase subunit L